MLATQLNSLVVEEKIKKNSLIRIGKVICNTVSNRRIIILLAVEVVQTDVPDVIGRSSCLECNSLRFESKCNG